MKKKIKIIGIVLVVLSLIIYSVYMYLKPLPVETKTLTLSESEISMTESGIVVNRGRQSVYPLVPGSIEQISVSEGDLIKKGDILATLNHLAIDFQVIQQEKTVEGYKAQLAGAEVENASSIDTLKGNRSNLYGQLKALGSQQKSEGQKELEQQLIEQSKAILDRGNEDLVKFKELYDNGYLSESDYKDYVLLVEGYATNYSQAVVASTASDDYYEGMKNSIYAQINSINKALEKDMLTATKAYYKSLIEATEASVEALKQQQSNYIITSPVSGIIDEILIDDINIVTGMEPAFIIQAEGSKEIEVKINTRDIDVIKVGDGVKISLDRRAGDIEMTGQILKIADSASLEISPLGIEERKVLVTIKPDKVEWLNDGYDVDVKFIVFSEKNKVVVPNSALYKKDDKDMAMIIRNGYVTEVEVELGYELTGETVIEKGLAEGDRLITDLDTKDLAVGKKAVSSNE